MLAGRDRCAVTVLSPARDPLSSIRIVENTPTQSTTSVVCGLGRPHAADTDASSRSEQTSTVSTVLVCQLDDSLCASEAVSFWFRAGYGLLVSITRSEADRVRLQTFRSALSGACSYVARRTSIRR